MHSYRVRLSQSATKDLDRALCWYDAESKALGDRFLKRYTQQRNALARNPNLYATFAPAVRRCTLKPFPYHVYYHVLTESKEVIIVAIYHEARDQAVLFDRIREY
ncbi:MAG TPA: hypothetical protein DCP28_00825 [Cytophagales bacterium]|nr:hypothetical protein [Cytophagales bacterium]